MTVVKNFRTIGKVNFILITLIFCQNVWGKVIYVDDDVAGVNDGTSWANAYWCLQDALADASTGDEIRVAQGIYKPDQEVMTGRYTRTVSSGDRTATFQLKNGVTIKGGYAGVDEPDPDVRDIEMYETILSGDLKSNDGLDFAGNGENSYNVITGTGTDETAVLDGLTITAGNANGARFSDKGLGGGIMSWPGSPTVTNCTFSRNSAQDGGGMFTTSNDSDPIVTNCTFTGNSAIHGGGMCNHPDTRPIVTSCTFSRNIAERGSGMFNAGLLDAVCTPEVTNCTFTGNTAQTDGGGICNFGYSNPTLTNCTFENNSAERDGGGMHNVNDSSPIMTNCTFENNSAERDGGGMSNNDNCSPIVTNCTFENNSAERDGGGIFNIDNSSPIVTNCTFNKNSVSDDGGGMNNQSESNPIVTNCTFTGNSARHDGSGMSNTNSSPPLANCTFEDNSAGGVGGGMFNHSNSSPVITDCAFSGNSAREGGGIWNWDNCNPTITNCIFSGNSATQEGGGIFNKIECEPMIVNCTFCGNSAGRGGAMYGREYSSSTLINSILWGNAANNGPQIALQEDSSVTVKYCDLQGGSPGIDVDQNSIVIWGFGNVDADPLFVNAADADYHLKAYSPCINAGDNSAIPQPVVQDIDGNPRLAYGIVDMGAYEYNPQLTTFDPIPADGVTDVTQTPILSWSAGERAVLHDVYFGTDEQTVRDATLRSPEYKVSKDLGSESYEPGELQWGITYYWRIDEYNTDETISKGSVWSFTVIVLADPLTEAMDIALKFTTGGSSDWFSQAITSYNDGDAAQSGDISHGQESWMQTTVSGAGTFSFYWKVSSEAHFDFLNFYIDGSLQDRISGSVDWQLMAYEITGSDLHTLEWRYVKDSSMNGGSDCGWVDNVMWAPIP